MKQMESQTTATVNELESERNQLLDQINTLFITIRDNEFGYRKSIKELNENIDKIEAKISKLDQFQRKLIKSKSDSSGFDSESNEDELKSKLNEMMAKESAYEETLSKADTIIASLEHNYRQRISELEASEACLKTRLAQLEDNESRVRCSMRTDRRSSEVLGKASDLVEQLIECRDRETKLKQQIKTLEASVTQIQTQIQTSEEIRTRVELELKDQDELLQTVHQLQEHNHSLKADLNKSLQSQDSLQEILNETEKYYQKKDEEMQNKYKCLQDEKCSLELIVTRLGHSLGQTGVNGLTNGLEPTAMMTNNDKIDAKCVIRVNANSETDSKPLKTDLDPTMDNMERCLQRAMAVIRLEIQHKVMH